MKIQEIVLQFAQQEIGQGEEGMNNAGPAIEKYLNEIVEPPANWCAAFVSWCYMKAYEEINKGKTPAKVFENPLIYSLSARGLMNQFKKNELLEFIPKPELKETKPIVKEPEPILIAEPIEKKPEEKSWWNETELIGGDLIFFWRESPDSWMGHVGIIESITDTRINTIEGNKGSFPSKVKRHYYGKNCLLTVLGFGRIK